MGGTEGKLAPFLPRTKVCEVCNEKDDGILFLPLHEVVSITEETAVRIAGSGDRVHLLTGAGAWHVWMTHGEHEWKCSARRPGQGKNRARGAPSLPGGERPYSHSLTGTEQGRVEASKER